MAATTDQWDANPWLLNTPDGTVDLKTGKQREHKVEDYFTRITAVGPGGDCPTWKKFLERVTGRIPSCKRSFSASRDIV